MNTTIRLMVKKEVDIATARKILKLKGSIIANSFTDLIHYDDAGEDDYIHYFITPTAKREQAREYIASYISDQGLREAVAIL